MHVAAKAIVNASTVWNIIIGQEGKTDESEGTEKGHGVKENNSCRKGLQPLFYNLLSNKAYFLTKTHKEYKFWHVIHGVNLT
jgi:hypothetical protein